MSGNVDSVSVMSDFRSAPQSGHRNKDRQVLVSIGDPIGHFSLLKKVIQKEDNVLTSIIN